MVNLTFIMWPIGEDLPDVLSFIISQQLTLQSIVRPGEIKSLPHWVVGLYMEIKSLLHGV